MSHTSSYEIHKYDAFLSFRGEDTRKTFVSHLYNALIQGRIDVFKDHERLETGRSISVELPKAIKESKFAIVIFSESYASSKWCLDELAHILKCRKELDQIVIPIFYNVDPSDVRHQTQTFSESFSKHEENTKTISRRFKDGGMHLRSLGKYQGIICKITRRGPRETLPLELKMGDFFNDGGEDGYVDARLMETKKLNEKSGLIVQGVEFRPE